MIDLARHLRPGRHRLGQSMLLLIAVSGAIILGLLAMHSLNRHTESAAPAPAFAVHDAGTADHGSTQPATHGECADCGGHTTMLAMACVLVLLAISMLILMPRLGISWGAALRAGPVRNIGTTVSRPPSLLILCISRT